MSGKNGGEEVLQLLEQRFSASGKDHNMEVHTEADIHAAVHGGSHPGAGGHTMKPFQPL